MLIDPCPWDRRHLRQIDADAGHTRRLRAGFPPANPVNSRSPSAVIKGGGGSRKVFLRSVTIRPPVPTGTPRLRFGVPVSQCDPVFSITFLSAGEYIIYLIPLVRMCRKTGTPGHPLTEKELDRDTNWDTDWDTDS